METRILKISSCLKQSIFPQINVNTMKIAEHMVDWLGVHQFIPDYIESLISAGSCTHQNNFFLTRASKIMSSYINILHLVFVKHAFLCGILYCICGDYPIVMEYDVDDLVTIPND